MPCGGWFERRGTEHKWNEGRKRNNGTGRVKLGGEEEGSIGGCIWRGIAYTKCI